MYGNYGIYGNYKINKNANIFIQLRYYTFNN